MNGRLYRLTPAGGKPNHYTDSYASARNRMPSEVEAQILDDLEVDDAFGTTDGTTVERVA